MESHTIRVGRVAQEICLGAIAGHLFVFSFANCQPYRNRPYLVGG